MTGKQLKNAILQLAIQGKLVPQNPADEPASALLAQIRKEKEQLVKAGKLKKKDLETTPISDEEKPFEIPESWEWVRLGNVINLLSGQDLTPNRYFDTKKGIPYITGASHFNNGKLRISRWTETPTSVSHKGDLLITCKGTVGTMAYNYVGDIHIARQIMAISPIGIHLPYIQVFLEFFVPELEKQAHSIIPGISREVLLEAVFPLPPLSEQHRIVAKIEELMPLVEEYGVAQEKLNRLNAALPAALKKSILQQAIQGKLVPQDAADEPSSALLAKIRKEKEQLVKAGKLKKKDLETTPITDEGKPFEIPESWEWVRLGDIFSHNNGKQLNRADTKGKLHDYITTSNLYWDNFDLKEVRQMLFTEDELVRCTATKGDLLVCEGGDVGRSAIWDKDYDICIQNHIHRLRAYSPLCTRYFLYLLMFNKSIGLIGGKGIGIQGLSATALHSIPVALPPLAEQRRIVAKIEELLAMVDGMK